MVTHVSSTTSSNASQDLSSRISSNRYVPYAESQAGSESASRRPPTSTYFRDPPRNHSRAPSTSSRVSSQSTLVQPHARSVAAYPPAPASNASSGPAPSAYRAPSAASTSAARPRHVDRSSSRFRRTREAEPEVQRNIFPWFAQTGDLEICLRDRNGRAESKYLLHRLILAQNSRWFETDVVTVANQHTRYGPADTPGLVGDRGSGLTTGPSAYTPSGNHNFVPSRLRYQLDWSRFIDNQKRIPALVVSGPPHQSEHCTSAPPVPTSNKPSLSSSSFLRIVTSSGSTSSRHHTIEQSEDADILLAYDNLLRSFYNHAPVLSTGNIAAAYVDSKLLISLASLYGAIDAAGPRVDHHLLQFGSRLWKQIAKYPPSYLKLGYLARSKAIFSEALVHVVGAWPAGQAQLRRGISGVADAVVDLIEDKVEEVEDTKLRVEAKLFRVSLTTGRGERVGPSNAYVDWLALSFFRQSIADNTTPPPASILKDSTARDIRGRTGGGAAPSRPQPQTSAKLVHTYRLLAAGGQAYLSHDDCKRFLKLRPEDYSRDNLRRFERRMEELKHMARDAVRPLSRNCLELDKSHGEMAYLTCSKCEEKDFAYIWNYHS